MLINSVSRVCAKSAAKVRTFFIPSKFWHNYLRKVPQIPNYKEKAVQSQIKTLNNQLRSQKDLLSIKESQYREIYAKRQELQELISKTSSGLHNTQYNDQGLNPLEYLYQSYILEIDNMENDFIRKQSL